MYVRYMVSFFRQTLGLKFLLWDLARSVIKYIKIIN